jgi:hypothetical protein
VLVTPLFGQVMCDRADTEIKTALANALWPRPAVRPKQPDSWTRCLRELPLEDHRRTVLEAAAKLIFDSSHGDEVDRAEELLLATRDHDLLDEQYFRNQKLSIGAGADAYDDKFYQAFLKGFALLAMERSNGLDRVGLSEVVRLRNSLTGSTSGRHEWTALEQTVRGFTRWPFDNYQQAARLLVDRTADQITQMRARFRVVEPRSLERFEERVEIAPPVNAFAAMVVPADCPRGVREAIRVLQGQPTSQNWLATLNQLRAAIREKREDLEKLSSSLPEGAVAGLARDLTRDEQSLTSLPMQPGILQEKIRDLVQTSSGMNRLRPVGAYRRALRLILEGAPAEAILRIRNEPAWQEQPRLAAALLAATYWAKGPKGLVTAKSELAVLQSQAVAAEYVRIARILAIPTDLSAVDADDKP